jgi:hypothetical protein
MSDLSPQSDPQRTSGRYHLSQLMGTRPLAKTLADSPRVTCESWRAIQAWHSVNARLRCQPEARLALLLAQGRPGYNVTPSL